MTVGVGSTPLSGGSRVLLEGAHGNETVQTALGLKNGTNKTVIGNETGLWAANVSEVVKLINKTEGTGS